MLIKEGSSYAPPHEARITRKRQQQNSNLQHTRRLRGWRTARARVCGSGLHPLHRCSTTGGVSAQQRPLFLALNLEGHAAFVCSRLRRGEFAKHGMDPGRHAMERRGRATVYNQVLAPLLGVRTPFCSQSLTRARCSSPHCPCRLPASRLRVRSCAIDVSPFAFHQYSFIVLRCYRTLQLQVHHVLHEALCPRLPRPRGALPGCAC